MEMAVLEVKRLRHPRKTEFLYFMGKFMFNMFTGMEMYYFASYLTDVALLPVALAGLAMTLPTVIDLIFSFVNGAIMEKLRVPIGKYRFWLMVGPVVATVTYAVCYIRVDNDLVCAILVTVMLIIAHFFWALAENTYTSLPAIITDDMDERSAMSMLCGMGANWSSFLFGLIGMPLIVVFNNLLSSTTHGYAVVTLLMGILYSISYILLALDITEVEKSEMAKSTSGGKKAKGPTWKEMLSNVAQNPPMIALMLYSLFYWIVSFVSSGFMAYYFNCTLGAAALMGLAMTTRSVGGMFTGFIYPLFMKLFKGSKRNLVIFGNMVNVVRMVIVWAVRPGPMGFIISNAICSLVFGLSIMPLIAMYSDCANYGEWKTGVASKSFVMSMYCIPLKIGLTGNRAILSVVLGIIGYNAMADPSQYAEAFNFSYNMLMAILTVIGCLILIFGYRLTEKRVEECTAEVEARKAAAGATEDSARS